MVVFSEYRKPKTNNVTWASFDGEKVETFPPEDLAGEILDRIENTKETFLTISNLSSVGIYVIYAILTVGYNLELGNPKVKKMHEKDVKYMCSGEGTFYSITIKRHKRGIVIADSDNIITLAERSDIIKSWGDPKLGNTPENLARATYAAVLGVTEGFKKKPVTISSAARRKWQQTHDYYLLNHWVQDCRNIVVNGVNGEKYFRPAYHGGLCAINLDNADKDGAFADVGSGLVLDVNGMYPWIMSEYPLPFGIPHEFRGKPDQELLDLANRGHIYIYYHFRAAFDLKSDGIPCVSVTGAKQSITKERGWLTTSRNYNRGTGKYSSRTLGDDGKEHESFVELTLTQTDFRLFLENYDVHKIQYIDGVWFAVSRSLFRDYVAHYQNEKKEAEKVHNKGARRIAKMFENSLSGNMARRTDIENLLIFYNPENGELTTRTEVLRDAVPSHVHIGAAITSYGRAYIIKHIKANRKYWIYTDTDSLHFKDGVDLSQFPIGEKLGEFKTEKTFTGGYYYKQKMYALRDADGAHLTFAGVPKASVRYLEDLLSGRDPEINPEADYIEPSLTTEQVEAIELLFAGQAPAEFDEIMSELTTSQERFRDLRESIDKLAEKYGDPLSGLYFLQIPVWERHLGRDGVSEQLHVVWRPVARINQWAQT